MPTQEITKATNWSIIDAGDNHTVATKSNGTLWAWGNKEYGEIGDELLWVPKQPQPRKP